jgi:hypothetical protein
MMACQCDVDSAFVVLIEKHATPNKNGKMLAQANTNVRTLIQ